MVNVVKRTCLEPTCTKHPSFGLPADERATYCCTHMQPGMVNVVSRRCSALACATVGHFKGHAGENLCATHAYEAGTLARPHPGASREACVVFDKLERELGITLQHIHFVPGQEVPTGREHRIPNTRYRVDAYDAASGDMYEYHGNAWHGYPPDHPKHQDWSKPMKEWNAVLYARTMERMSTIMARTGARLFYVWGHEYAVGGKKLFCNARSVLRLATPE